MENKDHGAWIVGGLTAVLFLGFVTLRPERAEPGVVTEATNETTTSSGSVVEEMPEQRATIAVPNDAVAQLQRAPSGQVYQCIRNGQRTFSDQPCGDDASLRAVKPNTYSTPASARPRFVQSPAPYSAVTDNTKGYQESDTQDCSALKAEVERIDERMRHGYDSRTGEWLREQHRQAVARRDSCIRGG